MDQLTAMTVTESIDKVSEGLRSVSSSLRHVVPHYEIDQSCQRIARALESGSERQAKALKSLANAINNLAKSNLTTANDTTHIEYKDRPTLTTRSRKALARLELSLGRELTTEDITSDNLLNVKNCGPDTVERILEWKKGLRQLP